MFAPYIKDFWFADIAYFGPDDPVDRSKPILGAEQGYELLNEDIDINVAHEKDWRGDNKYQGIPPCLWTGQYRHLNSNQVIYVHHYRRRGPTALRTRITNLGAFFYRGDGNEGGSGTLWIPNHIEEILERLINGGLIVTDGSNCNGTKTYLEMKRFHGDKKIGHRAVELANPFIDKDGNRFECVGYAGEKYGPTLVWQISKSRPVE